MRLETPLRLISHDLPGGRWYPTFATGLQSGHARLGELRLSRMRLQTPALFPVFNMLTGPATHGLKRTGGIFKFLKRSVLLENRYPCYLSEVLHFSDFSLSPSMLDTWLPRDGSKTLHTWMEEWYQEEGASPSRSVLFSDSGGFRLLFNTELDLEHFGVRPTARSILDLQLRYGADIVASLDYPLPPNTSPEEEALRSGKSQKNAFELMEMLDQRTSELSAPLPYLAIHGQTPEGIREYVRSLLKGLNRRGISRPFGLAIGSLVPRRSNYEVVVALVHAALDEVRQNGFFDPAGVPIHVFGITGDMIPVLAYLGVDTFDSSSHIQSARAFGYYDPDSWRPKKFNDLDDLVCECKACQEARRQGLAFLQKLRGLEGYRTHHNPRTGEEMLKSQAYALIAWHNLNLQAQEVDETRRAIADGTLLEHVVRVGTQRPMTEKLLSYLAEVDPKLHQRLVHVPQLVAVPESVKKASPGIGTYSLSYRPDDFNVLKERYRVSVTKKTLLIVPCSSEKPYSVSRSHRLLRASVLARLGEKSWREIEKVSLSGLYGPVPERFEEREEVRSYNYYLASGAHGQIELVADRLAQFLQKHGGKFERVIGYATTKAYRKAMSVAFDVSGYGELLPTGARLSGAAEFARQSNLDELAVRVADGRIDPRTQLTMA